MILHDFICETCDVKFEMLVRSDEFQVVHDECGQTAERIMSGPWVGRMNNPETQRAALEKRSYDHTIKESRSNADGLAAKMGGTAQPRAQQTWNIRTPKKAK